MSFVKKIWKNTIAQYPNRRTLTDTSIGSIQTVDVVRELGTVTQQGDTFDATTMNDLENRIDTAFTAVDNALTTESTKVTTLENALTTVSAKVTALESKHHYSMSVANNTLVIVSE